jgi:hypothetical protein
MASDFDEGYDHSHMSDSDVDHGNLVNTSTPDSATKYPQRPARIRSPGRPEAEPGREDSSSRRLSSLPPKRSVSTRLRTKLTCPLTRLQYDTHYSWTAPSLHTGEPLLVVVSSVAYR